MKLNLSRAQQRLLALVILLAAIGLTFAITVLPVWSMHHHYAATITRLEDRIEQLGWVAQMGEKFKKQYESLERSQVSDSTYLQSDTIALAGAELQRITKRVGSKHGADILSTQILPARDEQQFKQVTLKVRMRGTLPGVVQVFHAIETGEPSLLLENVSIRSHRRRRAVRAQSNQPQTLDLDFELVGYMRLQS